MTAAPLLLGCDLSSLDAPTLELVANRDLLAINQDPLGRPAERLRTHGEIEIWRRALADGSSAIGFVNRNGSSVTAAIDWSDLGLGPAAIRDVWAHRQIEPSDGWQDVLPAHGCVVLRVR
jgi:alpha-galactosidase